MRATPTLAVPCAIFGLLIGTAAYSVTTVLYDASLNTLPDAQGFTFFDGGPGAPAPTMSGGELLQGPVPALQQQYWTRSNPQFVFAQGFSIEADMRVEQSDYVILPQDGSQRSGFYVEAIDARGRRLTLGIAGSGVTVNTDRLLMPDNGIPLTGFTGGQFHVFKVVTSPDSIRLFIDGIRKGATVLGDSVFPGASSTFFGDGTTAAGCQVRIRTVRSTWPVSTTDVGAESRTPEGGMRIVPLAAVSRGQVDFAIPSAATAPVRIRVLDTAGRTVRDLGEAMVGPGGRRFTWDGRSEGGDAVPAGVYFAQASSRDQRASCRFVLLR